LARTKPKRPISEAQQAALARAREARAAKAPPPAPIEGDVLDSQDEVESLLGDFAARWQASKGKRGEQARLAKEIVERIGQLDPAAYPEVFQDEKFQAFLEAAAEKVPAGKELPPGTAVRKGPFIEDKVPWTWEHLREERGLMPWVDYTPRGLKQGREYVGWNGLSFVFVEDQTVHVPKCFVDVLEEAYRHGKEAELHAKYLMRQAVPRQPLLANDTSVRVRASWTGGSMRQDGAGSNWEADQELLNMEKRLSGEEEEELEEATA